MKRFLTLSLILMYLVAWLPAASVVHAVDAPTICGSGTTPACFYFAPATGNISVTNSNITVDVAFDTGNQDSMGADAWVRFRTSEMQFVSGTFLDSANVDSTGHPVYPQKISEPISADSTGLIKLTRLINFTSPAVYNKGRGVLARLTFRPLGAIGSTVYLSFDYTANQGGGDSSIAGTVPGVDILGRADAATLTLASGPTTGPLDHVDITPASAAITPGGTQSFTAVGKDASGNSVADVTYAWTEIGNGTVNPTAGSTTTYTAGSAAETATVTVTATQTSGTGGTITKTANATVTVSATAGVLDRVELTPTTATVPQGGTQSFTAVAKDINGNTISNATYAWTVSTGGTVSPASGTTTTFTAGAANGTATVTVTATQGSGTSTVTKTAAATVTIGNFTPGPTPGAGPYITSLSPATGQKDATPQATITGGNFGTYDSATSKVYFGMNTAVVLDWSASRIVVRVPAASDITSRLTVTVRVVTNDAKSAEYLGYTYTLLGVAGGGSGSLPSNGPETYTWIGLLMAAAGFAGLAYMKLTGGKPAANRLQLG